MDVNCAEEAHCDEVQVWEDKLGSQGGEELSLEAVQPEDVNWVRACQKHTNVVALVVQNQDREKNKILRHFFQN